MRNRAWAMVTALALVAGGVAGTALAKKEPIHPSTYVGKAPAEAAAALLDTALAYAGDGTFERIHVARVYILGGMEEKGEALIEAVLAGPKVEAGDWIRIGRIHAQAGHWDEARKAFDSVLAMAPDDEDWLAEIGAYYNLNGDRKTAEELFERSFLEKPLLKNVLTAAGSYVGVTPRQQ